MPEVRSGDATLHYRVHGEGPGPSLVLAHGAGGNQLSWWQQIPVFAERQPVVVFDHRGFGRSSCDEFHPRHFVADLEAILAAEGIERVALVCQSMGGWTGLHFALRHPERVSALVLACTPGGYTNGDVLASAASLGPRIEAAGLDHTPALGAGFVRRHPELRFLYDEIGALNAVDVGAVSKLFDPEVRLSAADVEQHRVPTLMLTGSEDLLFPSAVMRSVAGEIPGAHLEEVDDAGHSIYFERPELFNRLVGDFLARHETS
jgi:3-oxoadipate enol-lactonase